MPYVVIPTQSGGAATSIGTLPVSSSPVGVSGQSLIVSGSTWTPQYGNGPVYNVKDFGAVGDGVHDDTAAIQQALDAGGTVRSTVYFPAGFYLVKCPPAGGAALTVRYHPVNIVGVGINATNAPVNSSNIMVHGSGNPDCGLLVENALGYATNFTKISGMNFTGYLVWPRDLIVVHSAYFVSEDNQVSQAQRNGILIESNADTTGLWGVYNFAPGTPSNSEFPSITRTTTGFCQSPLAPTGVLSGTFYQPAAAGTVTASLSTTRDIVPGEILLLVSTPSIGYVAPSAVYDVTAVSGSVVTLRWSGNEESPWASGSLVSSASYYLGAGIAIHGYDSSAGIIQGCSATDNSISFLDASLAGQSTIQCYSQASMCSYICGSVDGSSYYRCGSEDEIGLIVLPAGGRAELYGSTQLQTDPYDTNASIVEPLMVSQDTAHELIYFPQTSVTNNKSFLLEPQTSAPATNFVFTPAQYTSGSGNWSNDPTGNGLNGGSFIVNLCRTQAFGTPCQFEVCSGGDGAGIGAIPQVGVPFFIVRNGSAVSELFLGEGYNNGTPAQPILQNYAHQLALNLIEPTGDVFITYGNANPNTYTGDVFYQFNSGGTLTWSKTLVPHLAHSSALSGSAPSNFTVSPQIAYAGYSLNPPAAWQTPGSFVVDLAAPQTVGGTPGARAALLVNEGGTTIFRAGAYNASYDCVWMGAAAASPSAYNPSLLWSASELCVSNGLSVSLCVNTTEIMIASRNGVNVYPTYNLGIGASYLAYGSETGVLALAKAGTNPTTAETWSEIYADHNTGDVCVYPAGTTVPTIDCGVSGTQFTGAPSLGGGMGVIGIGNAVIRPGSSPSAGGVLFAVTGSLYWKGSSGTVTQLALP